MHHFGRRETQHCDAPRLPGRFLLITILVQPDHHIDISTENRVAFVRLLYYRERLVGLSCENLSGVSTDDTEYYVFHCLRAAGASS